MRGNKFTSWILIWVKMEEEVSFLSSLSLPNCTTNWSKNFLNTVAQCLNPRLAGARLQWKVAEKSTNTLEKGPKVSLRQIQSVPFCGSCSADWLRCFGLNLTYRWKRKVLKATQQCPQCLIQWAGLPIAKRKMPSVSADQNPRHSSTFVPSHPVEIHSI